MTRLSDENSFNTWLGYMPRLDEIKDIDVLVLLKGPVKLGEDLMTNIETLYPLTLKWGHSISPKPVDAEEYRTYDCPLFRSVREEGISA